MTWNDVLTIVNAGDTLLGVAILGWLGWKVWRKVRREAGGVTLTMTTSEAKRTVDLLLAHYEIDAAVLDSAHGDSDSG